MKGQSGTRIEDKIQSIRKIECLIPAVLIIHELPSMHVAYMSINGQRILGLSLDELRAIGEDYHHEFFHPDFVTDSIPQIMEMIRQNRPDYEVTYFQQVRPSAQHDWSIYLSTTKIIHHNEAGEPTYILTTAVPINTEHHISHKVERLIEENNLLRRNHHLFKSLTRREVEILRLMALGFSSSEISGKVFISEKTANTHRRNIRAKLKVESNYELVRFAQVFDLI
jgi:DNA-binding CsgD family transcriptional regulator